VIAGPHIVHKGFSDAHRCQQVDVQHPAPSLEIERSEPRITVRDTGIVYQNVDWQAVEGFHQPGKRSGAGNVESLNADPFGKLPGKR